MLEGLITLTTILVLLLIGEGLVELAERGRRLVDARRVRRLKGWLATNWDRRQRGNRWTVLLLDEQGEILESWPVWAADEAGAIVAARERLDRAARERVPSGYDVRRVPF